MVMVPAQRRGNGFDLVWQRSANKRPPAFGGQAALHNGGVLRDARSRASCQICLVESHVRSAEPSDDGDRTRQ